MQVKVIKVNTRDTTIALGNNGIVLKIADNEGKHVGYLRIGRAIVEWRPGRTRSGNGRKIKVQDTIHYLNSR